VLLYGSLARGAAGPDSDWDLLVLTGKPSTSGQRQRVSDVLYGLELQHGLVISELVCSRDEWEAPVFRVGPLHQNVEREGVVI
jgi:predicted nucleotidyltransferase